MRHLIGFVERWAEVGEPTPRARVAEIHAFLSLCLLDRAWIRLEGLPDDERIDPQALVAIGTGFLDHGWPARARRPFERALRDADDNSAREIRALLSRCEGATHPPPGDPPDGADFATVLHHAERQLASGAPVKAQRILERLKRERPDHPRVDDLLWGLAGDFGMGRASLDELIEKFTPDPMAHLDVTEEAEHTESVTREQLLATERAEAEEGNQRAFPSLFKPTPGLPEPVEPTSSIDGPPPGDEDSGEITQSSSMASLTAMHAAAAAPSPDDTMGGDTQIVRVIRTDKGTELVPGGRSMHVPQQQEETGAFDLAAFRREMGMPSNPTMDVPPTDLEAEDDARIIMKRPSAADPSDEPSGAGLELIEPDTTSEIRAGMAEELRRMSEAPTIVDRTPDPPPSAAKPAAKQARSATPSPARRRKSRAGNSSSPWWLLALGLVLLLATGVLFLAAVVQLVQLLA
jgi:hypothetical protein